MTWIKTVRPRELDAEQKARFRDAFRWRSMYPPEYGAEIASLKEAASEAAGGGISDAHTLLPDSLYHAFALFGTLLQPDLPLSRAQHEMIAATVSVINHCFY